MESDANSPLAWHSNDGREFKKLKPSVPGFLKKDAEIPGANSRCIPTDSHPNILEKEKDAETPGANSRCIPTDSHPNIFEKEKDAETPESKSRRMIDMLKKFKEWKQTDISKKDGKLRFRDIDHMKDLEEMKRSRKPMKSHPDILKKLADKLEAAERMEADSKCIAMSSHQDFFKKCAAGVEERSRCIDDLKKKFERMRKALNENPDNSKKAALQNMEGRFQYLDFLQEHSRKLMSSVKIPISTEREESDDEIEFSMAPPLNSPLNKSLSRLQNEAEINLVRVDESDEVKKAVKDMLERFQSGGSVFSDLMIAE